MQDSSITITVTAVDGATKVFTGIGDAAVKQANKAAAAWQKANDVSNVSIESAGGAADATNEASKAQDNLTASTKRSYFAQTALTTILSAGINKAFLTMVDVTGQAIQRVDLIANFPKTMESLGISATDASAALSKLSGYVASVGGNLQDATTTVTRFAEVTHNVSAATAEFEGVNNALIAGGASADVQSDALEQLTQAYSRGVPQLIEYKSLLVAMPAQLNEVAQALKEPNAQALGTALTTGKISMQDFITELTKLGTGTGVIAQQANAHLSGIQFGFNQFKNTLVTGMTEIIQEIGRQNIVAFFSVLTGVVKQLAVWAVDLIGILFSLFNAVSQVFGGPQLKLANDSTAGIASNLADSADDAGDLADNLGDAGDAAAKTADQLASFDKMNVLTSPDTSSGSGSGDTSGVGDSGLSPTDASTLDGIFSDMAAQMQKITGAAKILAGIIAGLVGIKFAEGLLNQFNGIISTAKETASNLDNISKKLFGFKDGEKQVDGLVQKLGNLGKSASDTGAEIGGNIVTGLTFAFAKVGEKVFSPLIDGAVAAGGAILDALALVGAIVAEILLLPEELALGVLIAIGVAVVAIIAGIGILIAKNWTTIVNAIETVVGAVVGFFEGIFTTVYTFISGIFDDIVTFFEKWGEDILVILLSPFILIVAGIVLIVGALVDFFTLLIATIVTIVSAIVGFFITIFTDAWNAVVVIWDIVAGWFNVNVILPIIAFFTPIVAFFSGIFSAAWNAIVVVWDIVAGWFNANVWQPIVGIFNVVASFFGGVFSTAWDNIKSVFSGVANWFNANVWQPIVNLFSAVGTSIGNAISGAFKAVVNEVLSGAIGIINDFLGLLRNAIGVINKVPGVNISTSGIKNIPVPQLATGGIVTSPTLALIGESGPEAVMPLQDNTDWIDMIASKINSSNGSGDGTGQPVSLTVQIGEDKVATKLINLINEKTQMSGRNTVLV